MTPEAHQAFKWRARTTEPDYLNGECLPKMRIRKRHRCPAMLQGCGASLAAVKSPLTSGAGSSPLNCCWCCFRICGISIVASSTNFSGGWPPTQAETSGGFTVRCELTALGVLVRAFRQGRLGLRGWAAEMTDIPMTSCSRRLTEVCVRVLGWNAGSSRQVRKCRAQVNRHPLEGGIGRRCLFMIITVFEELIVRAFGITQLRHRRAARRLRLRERGHQFSYHLKGLPAAPRTSMFLIYYPEPAFSFRNGACRWILILFHHV